jgi:hypothetical protein
MVPNSPDEQQAAFHAFEVHGTLFLKPVYEKLGGKISYDELKIIRLIYLTTKEPPPT